MLLPPLRQELALHPGPRGWDGQPAWTLHDPAVNRFFRLDWLTFEILSRWSLGEPRHIAAAVRGATPLHAGEDDVQSVLLFLFQNQLLQLAGADTSARLADELRRRRPSWWQWLLHNYLFFYVPLVRPERALRALVPRLGFLFRPFFWQLTAGVGALGLFLVARQWDAFVATGRDLFTPAGALGFGAALLLAKVLHECGHGLTAVRHGCRVPSMGVAFLVMTPVPYTDTNDAWKLADRGPRLAIGAAGMLAELALAAWATAAWSLLPAGAPRTALFVIASVTWVKSLLVNLSPLMRFDGYYLLSDLLDLPNLHTRAFRLARWWLRERLFGLGEPPPERFPAPLTRFLVGFSWFVWVYRLVVFFGIALFVYHYFFKALGLVLFAVEVGWFIVRPIASELAAWWARRDALRRSHRWRSPVGGLLVLLTLLLVPWPHRIREAAELRPRDELRVGAPEAAQIEALPWRDGDAIPAGAVLARLRAPMLEARHATLRNRVSRLEREVAGAAVAEDRQARLPILRAELETARAALRETENQRAQLAPVAPYAGVFRSTEIDLHPGDTVARQEVLGILVAAHPWEVVAYLDETAAAGVHVGDTARFYATAAAHGPLRLRVVAIDRDASRSLTRPLLARPFGGTVAAHASETDLVPDVAVYRVLLAVEEEHLEPAITARASRGYLVLSTAGQPPLRRAFDAFLSVLWREAGF